MKDNQEKNYLNRVPPQNLEAEKAIIAAIIIDKEAISKAVGVLNLDDFYLEAHQLIYSAILDLYDKSTPADLVTLGNYLISKNQLEKVGGSSYINEITRMLASTANIEYYINIVKDKAELRKLIHSSVETIEEAYDASENVSDIVDKAEARIFEVADKRIKTGLTPIRESINPTVNFLEKIYHNKEHITGVPTGYTDLDKMTAGFQKSDLIIIAARPSVGKTALILNIAENMAIKSQKSIAIFSLEMAQIQLCQRFICSYSKLDSHKARTGDFNESDFHKITKAAGKLMSAKIFIDDSSQINVLEMKAKARRMKARHGLDIIFIDYLQLISSPSTSKYENRQNEVAKISRSLKQLARELDVPVIAAAQLNRMVENRQDKRPLLSDLRDSGAIEQDADVIMFLHRDDYQKNENSEENEQEQNENTTGKAELIIAKQRNGPTGIVNLTFLKQYTRFENYISEEQIRNIPSDYQ